MKLNDLPVIDPALAPQAISTEVLLEKYAKGSESSAKDIHRRVSRALACAEQPADREHWQEEFLAALAKGFVPAGRINSAGGTDIQATLINCFVQPVGDSVSEDADGKPSIYKALAPGRRDHASRWWCRLRLQPHPSPRRDGQGHALQCLRAGELHAHLRPLVRDGRVRRRATWNPAREHAQRKKCPECGAHALHKVDGCLR
jgi:hypothetical protein